MGKAADSPLLRRFTEAVNGNELPSALRLMFRLVGGMPHERLDHSLTVDDSGAARVHYEDRLRKIGPIASQGPLTRKELMDFLRSIARGSSGLVFEDEAQFVPGAVTGRLRLTIGDRSETYWFGVPDPGDDDEDVRDAIAEGYHLAPQLDEARALFEQYSKRLRSPR